MVNKIKELAKELGYTMIDDTTFSKDSHVVAYVILSNMCIITRDKDVTIVHDPATYYYDIKDVLEK